MNRLGFLKRASIPVAVVAATAAAKLDPGGEDMREVDGQLVVYGDNVTIQNTKFVTRPASTAISVQGSTGMVIRNNVVEVPRD